MNSIDNSVAVQIFKKSFRSRPDENVIVRDLHLQVESGSFVTLIAPSGAGKTTLLRMIAGLEVDYEGSTTLAGVRVTAPTRDIQLVFQEYALLPWKTAVQNLTFAAHDRDRKHAKRASAQLLADVGLGKIANRWPRGLSGGEAGRVAFARALMDRPRVLLLDEPFRNLDVFNKTMLQDHLIAILSNKNTTTIMASHNVEDAVFLSDRIYIFDRWPLRVKQQVDIDVPRPRERADVRLAQIGTSVMKTCVELQAAGLTSVKNARSAEAGAS
jgi:ABC-type nitrate/sulfonate/bicarbonate transport system ATPase subunit